MLFDVLITKIINARARPILMRYLAHGPSMSLQKAQESLDNLPVTYVRGVDEKEAKAQLLRLQSIGVQAHIIESEPQVAPPERGANQGTEVTEDAPTGDHHQEPEYIPDTAAALEPEHEPAANPELKSPPVTNPPEPPEPFSVRPTRSTERGERISSALLVRSTPKRQTDRTVYVVAGFLFFLIVGGTISYSTSARYGVKAVSPASSRAGSIRSAKTPLKAVRQKATTTTRADKAESTTKPATTAHNRRESRALTDSARTLGATIDAIKFYKAAISLNEHNYDAWQGLLAAYRERGMNDDAARTRVRMIEIFGEGVFSVQSVVERFGSAQEISLENGTLRLEYQTTTSGEKDLIKETYHLMKALRVSCNCEALSVYARSKRGGVLAFLPVSPFPTSLEDYRRSARLTVL